MGEGQSWRERCGNQSVSNDLTETEAAEIAVPELKVSKRTYYVFTLTKLPVVSSLS